MRQIYSLFILLYGFSIRLASLFNAKAALWIHGRRGLFVKVEEDLKNNHKPLIWMHTASLGEFEQGRPVLEAIKAKHPDYGIVLTFFSPSGYEVRKNYDLADFVYYLPLDTPKNAKRFLELVPIKLAIFVKYEYWYNYMDVLHKKSIPLVFVSAIFRPKQIFFQDYGSWFLKHLKNVAWFFVQTQASLDLLQKTGITNASLSGDTRFDRVADIASKAKINDLVAQFKGGSKLLLVGSSWPEDETLIYPLLNTFPDLKIVFAPHLIDAKHINQIEKNSLGNSVLYSKATLDNVSTKQVLIVDNFGLLSGLYRYADFTYIGGGFGAGIHNTLEAATFGMPIFIGPNYEKFAEATDLVELGAIEVLTDTAQLEKNLLHLITFPEKSVELGQQARDYVKRKTGATKHILAELETKFLL